MHPDTWLGRPHKNAEHLVNALHGRSPNDLAIVLSTIWKRQRSRRQLFRDLPEALHPWIKGATPDVEAVAGPGTRSAEIALFLAKTGYQGPWLALDDLSNLFEPKDHAHLMLIPGSTGLTSEHTQALRLRLNQHLGSLPEEQEEQEEQEELQGASSGSLPHRVLPRQRRP